MCHCQHSTNECSNILPISSSVKAGRQQQCARRGEEHCAGYGAGYGAGHMASYLEWSSSTCDSAEDLSMSVIPCHSTIACLLNMPEHYAALHKKRAGGGKALQSPHIAIYGPYGLTTPSAKTHPTSIGVTKVSIVDHAPHCWDLNS